MSVLSSPRSGSTAPVRSLRETLCSGLEEWVPYGSEVALIDVPANRNAGDLFILAATDRMLTAYGCRVVYRAGVRDYRRVTARRQIGPATLVICLGGGSFGDLYPRYQSLRERVVRDFPHNRMVVLPQTVHFEKHTALERSARRLARHRQLRIAVRDRPSLDLVRRHVTRRVQLLPDLVHWIAPVSTARSAGGRNPTLSLLRRDSERAPGPPPSAGSSAVLDWPDLLPGFRRRVAAAVALMPIAPHGLSSRLHRWWSSYAQRLLGEAIDRIGAFERVVTDRLHGAILARLAGRPVSLVDNSYGKLSAYHQAWWQDDHEVELARTAGPR